MEFIREFITFVLLIFSLIQVHSTYKRQIQFEERQNTWLTKEKLITKVHDTDCEKVCRNTAQCRAYRFYNDNSIYKTTEPTACWLYKTAKFMPESTYLKNHFNVGIEEANQDSMTSEFIQIKKTWLHGSTIYHLYKHYGSFFECEGACVRTEGCDGYSWEKNGECYLFKDPQVRNKRSRYGWNSGIKLCPYKYIHGGDSMHPKCYRFETNSPKSWKTALRICEQEGAKLVSIETQEEHDYLTKYFLHKLVSKNNRKECVYPFKYGGINFTTCILSNTLNTYICGTSQNTDIKHNKTNIHTCYGWEERGFWTSGHKVDMSTWQWNSTEKIVKFNQWAPGIIPTSPEDKEDCLEVVQKQYQTESAMIKMSWNNLGCNQQTRYVCERDPVRIPRAKIPFIVGRSTDGSKPITTTTSTRINATSNLRRNPKTDTSDNIIVIILIAITVVVIIAVVIIIVVCIRKRQNHRTQVTRTVEAGSNNVTEPMYEVIGPRVAPRPEDKTYTALKQGKDEYEYIECIPVYENT